MSFFYCKNIRNVQFPMQNNLSKRCEGNILLLSVSLKIRLHERKNKNILYRIYFYPLESKIKIN